MPDKNYCLKSSFRDVVFFGQEPDEPTFEDLPVYYSGIDDYYHQILVPNQEKITSVIVEEHSLSTMLRDDIDAMGLYLSPLVEGDIVHDTINYIVTLSGWFIVNFDVVANDGSSITVLYLAPTPIGTVMCPMKGTFDRLHYTSIH